MRVLSKLLAQYEDQGCGHDMKEVSQERVWIGVVMNVGLIVVRLLVYES